MKPCIWLVMVSVLVAACDPATAEDLRAEEQADAAMRATAAASTTLAPTTTTIAPTTTSAAPETSTTHTSTTLATTTSTSLETTTSTAPTTTTEGRRLLFTVDRPTARPPQQDGAGGYLGSGCSPGSSTLPDGIWAGEMVRAAEEYVEFDLMCISVPDDDDRTWITNSNTTARLVPIDPTAAVYPIVGRYFGPPVPYEQWFLDPEEVAECPPNGCWHGWLYVNDGMVTEIVQFRIS